MIELGEISITSEKSFYRARNKLFTLAQDLGFNDMHASRIGIITSELTRDVWEAGQVTSISVYLKKSENRYGLCLNFAIKGNKTETDSVKLSRFFDKVHLESLKQNNEVFVETFTFLPDPYFEPMETFIQDQRTKIGQLTEIEKLYLELSEAHKHLQQQTLTLAQSEKMRAIGTLVAGVAHELNNPMMGILNYTQYCIKHTSKDDRKYPILQDIDNETKRCINIVSNLLTFSHSSAEGSEHHEFESLEKVIDRVLKLLSYRIEKENVDVNIVPAEGIPEIKMNINEIQQMLLNIIVNALDAQEKSKKREIIIVVDLRDEYVCTDITDNGPGIPSDVLPHIFDPFFTTKPPGKGTGLGLSLSQKIIEDHGGKILCENSTDKGVTFKIMLPVTKQGGR